jgi:hypothetical protein
MGCFGSSGTGGVSMSWSRISKTTSKLLIVFLLQGLQLLGEIPMRLKHLPQPDEGPHDGDVDLHGASALEDAGEHRDTLLGERVRQLAGIAMLLRTGHKL